MELYYYRSAYAPEDDDWAKKVLTFKTGPNAESVKIILQVSYPDNTVSGNVWFDNLRLVNKSDLDIYDYSPLGAHMPFVPEQSIVQIMYDISTFHFHMDLALEEFSFSMEEIYFNFEEININFDDIIAALDEINAAMDRYLEALNIVNNSLKEINTQVQEIIKIQDEYIAGLKDLVLTIDDINQQMGDLNKRTYQYIEDQYKAAAAINSLVDKLGNVNGSLQIVDMDLDTLNSVEIDKTHLNFSR